MTLLCLAAFALQAQDAEPTERELAGREIYIAKACWQCHSQEAGPREVRVAKPMLPATERTGPDLFQTPRRRSESWQRAHLFAPRTLDPHSSMPRFRELFDTADGRAVQAFLKKYDTKDGGRDQDGIVTRTEYTAAGGEDWRAELERLDRRDQRFGANAPRGDEIISLNDAAPVWNDEGRALVAYLGRLGTSKPGASVAIPPRTATTSEQRREAIERGSKTYARHCASCHGKDGAGDGPAAMFFSPRPRNFLRGNYRFRSTPVGNPPLDADLYRSIRRGVGMSMPAWPTLSDGQVWDLVEYLKSHHPLYLGRELFVDLHDDPLMAFVQWTDSQRTDEKLAELETDEPGGAQLGINRRLFSMRGRWWIGDRGVVREVKDGFVFQAFRFRLGITVFDWLAEYDPEPRAIAIGEEPFPFSDESVSRGERVFMDMGCAQCHGATGRGDGLAAITTRGALGEILPPTDYTRGAMHLKGGSDTASIVRTILTGMQGTPMPGYAANFAADPGGLKDLWHLAHFIQRQSRAR
ncbi:MAG: c-type cytochrome [Planctomycetota bacterium]